MIFSNIVDEEKRFAWIPARMDNGDTVWMNYYYIVTTFTMTDTRARWLSINKYSSSEYFLKKMSE